MGQYSKILSDDLIVNIIWPKIEEVNPIEEWKELCHNLRLCNKSWKNFVDNNEAWKIWTVLHMDVQMDNLTMEAHREEAYKKHGGSGSYYSKDFDREPSSWK